MTNIMSKYKDMFNNETYSNVKHINKTNGHVSEW